MVHSRKINLSRFPHDDVSSARVTNTLQRTWHSSQPPHRWIAHVDLDAFFASCEQREHPEYKGRPVVVGALPGHRGVVAAASYEARRFGIRSAMPISEAWRRCPDAVFLRPDMDKYRRVSRQVFQVLETMTPAVESASIDEAYLDVTGFEKLVGPPETIGREIKHRIFAETGLTASVGIGPNRLIAKLGSEYHKPDGLTVVSEKQVLDFLAPMPVSNLRGLGRQTQKVFTRLGISTVAQLRAVPLPLLQQELGENAADQFSPPGLWHCLGSGRAGTAPKEYLERDDIRGGRQRSRCPARYLTRAGGRCGGNGTPGGFVRFGRDTEDPLRGIRDTHAATQAKRADPRRARHSKDRLAAFPRKHSCRKSRFGSLAWVSAVGRKANPPRPISSKNLNRAIPASVCWRRSTM